MHGLRSETIKDMELIFGGLIVRPVWIGITRTRPSALPLDSILPLQILTSAFHHFTEAVQTRTDVVCWEEKNDQKIAALRSFQISITQLVLTNSISD
ncbi:hypothetical protein TNCV_4379191 [Trichonephila clavipes]|nr:hypothetical protein TNCV_4379191 [Trichonephila clavipes]